MTEEQNSGIESFADLGLNEVLVDSLIKGGYEKPTELQKKMVGPLMQGHDMVAKARRGQGKTLSYLMPILHQIDLEDGVQAVIVSPTRELAIDICRVSQKLMGQAGLRSLALHPGADTEEQAGLLEKQVQLVTGTPGRLLDMIERQVLTTKTIKFVVFDELDRLLNSGHLEPMRRLMHELAHGRQLIWIASAIDEEIELLASKYLVEPLRAEWDKPETRLGRPVHELVLGPQRGQVATLRDRIREIQPAAAIVITSRRDDAHNLSDALRRADLTVMNMDSEAAKLQRRGRSGRSRAPAKPPQQDSVVWVASEMVTRAIDLPHVGILAHFGPPPGPEVYADYVCRLVRLGADLQRVVTLVEPPQRGRLEELFAAVNLQPEITEVQVPEGEQEEEVAFEPTRTHEGRGRERGERRAGPRDRQGGRDRGGRGRREGGRGAQPP